MKENNMGKMTLEDILILNIYQSDLINNVNGAYYAVNTLLLEIDDLTCRNVAEQAINSGLIEMSAQMTQVPKVRITTKGKARAKQIIAEAEKQE